MELAIINGTYRDTSKPPTTQAGGQSSTSTRKSGGSRRPLATHASSVCSVYSFMFFSLLSSPLAVCVYFFALWCFFFGLRNFFFLPPPWRWPRLMDWVTDLCSSSCMIDRFYILSPCDGILSFCIYHYMSERRDPTRHKIIYNSSFSFFKEIIYF